MDYKAAWQQYQSLTYDDLPGEVQTIAGHCILDWIGCATAGATEPLAGILRDTFGHRSGECSLIGSDIKVDAPTAALLNGASGHALDFDDTGSQTLCHSTTPVLPAALAMAEAIGASGQQLVTAFVVGVEILGRVAQAMGSDHYVRGWHTTATYGTFGAAAAAAHLLGFDDRQFNLAMGLAASHASGVKANFGTMTKPYHAGHAAEGGLNSAMLIQKGFTADPEAVSGNQGFIGAASNGQARDFDGGDWLIMGTLFKYHAACHLTHASIESILKLKTTLDASDLSALTITVHPSLLDVCGIENPQTGLEGKFSLRGTASLALCGINTADPRTFVDETIMSDPVQALISKVTVETDTSLANMQSRVTWVDKDQRRHEQFWDVGTPATDLTEQGQKLAAKFDSLCDFAGRPSHRKDIEAIARQPTVKVG